jgi:hypothetical protein
VFSLQVLLKGTRSREGAHGPLLTAARLPLRSSGQLPGIAAPESAQRNICSAALLPGIAFVTQSGAIMTGIVDWASARGIGFSHLVSVGGMADVDFGDLLDYFAQDAATSAILLYMEAVTEARKFMSAARAPRGRKPSSWLKVAVQKQVHARRRRIRARSPAPMSYMKRRFGAPACCASMRWRNCSMPPRR